MTCGWQKSARSQVEEAQAMSSSKKQQLVEHLSDPMNAFSLHMGLTVAMHELVLGAPVTLAMLTSYLGQYVARVAKPEHMEEVAEAMCRNIRRISGAAAAAGATGTSPGTTTAEPTEEELEAADELAALGDKLLN